MNIPLKRKLPPNRSYGQVYNHYLVEKSIADRLKISNREERRHLFASMYDELFSKVPDHPRLTRRKSEEETRRENKTKYSILSRYLRSSSVVVEFAPGDCRFSHEISKNAKFVYGVDISDQRNPDDPNPDNFRLIVYDGYSLPEVENNSCDVIFSYQLIEHLHPEDTLEHFNLAHKILKAGGIYVFQTPHAFSGPHDISGFFCDDPEGFHLKEWTYKEMMSLIEKVGYKSFISRIALPGLDMQVPNMYFVILEGLLGLFSKKIIRRVSGRMIPNLYAVAVK